MGQGESLSCSKLPYGCDLLKTIDDNSQQDHSEDQSQIGDLAHLGMDSRFVAASIDESHIADIAVKDSCNLTQSDETVGDHICRVTCKVGEDSRGSLLAQIISSSRDILIDKFDLSEEDLDHANSLTCAVSRVSEEDCPLVFVSEGFEKLTGYSSEFAMGRSCRFLQPTSKSINDAMNIKDRKSIKEFCEAPFARAPGSELVNLLINERYDGARYWNLLKMVYVTVGDEPYIFSLQTPLDAYIPKALKGRISDAKRND
jgi:hypothetical protein